MANLFASGTVMIPLGIYFGVSFRYYKLERQITSEQSAQQNEWNSDNCKLMIMAKRKLFITIVLLPNYLLVGMVVAFKE